MIKILLHPFTIPTNDMLVFLKSSLSRKPIINIVVAKLSDLYPNKY